jgi:hypothetical protein
MKLASPQNGLTEDSKQDNHWLMPSIGKYIMAYEEFETTFIIKSKPLSMIKKTSNIFVFAISITSFPTLPKECSSHQHRKLKNLYVISNFHDQPLANPNEYLLIWIQNDQNQSVQPESFISATYHSKIPERLLPNIFAENTQPCRM